MHSRNQITPFRGGQQGYIHFSDLMPKDDPYASWEVQADSGLLLPTRKIPPKRKSFSGYVPFPEHGRVVWYESLLEQSLLLGLRHLVPLPYVLEQPMRLRLRALGYKGTKYTPDFLIWTPGVPPTIVEVKYEGDLCEHWEKLKPKLMAARRYARLMGWQFRLVTDRHLLPGGVRSLRPTLKGLVSPYLRISTPIAGPTLRPVIWGALPGRAGDVHQKDRSGLLIPGTARLMERIFMREGSFDGR